MDNSALAVNPAAFLDAVNARMKQLIIRGKDPVPTIVGHLFSAGGKRIRPLLVWAAASFKAADPKILIDAATAIELVHMASLIHDDVIDKAASRRGRATINHKWDNLTAVLAGDYLFASAFNLLTTAKNFEVLEYLTHSIQLMCEGEINQSAQSFNYEQSEKDYFLNIYKKTACLFATSCFAGALSAGLPRTQVNLLEKYGLYLGYAYQILDDILDIVAQPAELGKPVGSDLKNGILTLPVLRLLQDEAYAPALKKLFEQRHLAPAEVRQIIGCLIRSRDGISYAWKRLIEMIGYAHGVLQALPAAPARPAISELSAHLFAKPLALAKPGLEPLGIKINELFNPHSNRPGDEFPSGLYPPAEWLPSIREQIPLPEFQESYA